MKNLGDEAINEKQVQREQVLCNWLTFEFKVEPNWDLESVSFGVSMVLFCTSLILDCSYLISLGFIKFLGSGVFWSFVELLEMG